VGSDPLGLDAMIDVAVHGRPVRLADDAALAARLETAQRHLATAISNDTPVYGVTTGFGSNCATRIAPAESRLLGARLLRFHGCGTGPALPEACVRGAMLSRVLCFSLGYSGVTMGLLERLVAFLNRQITPVVPAQGSVGASGDLTPMSYVASALAGERDVFFGGERMPAAKALQIAGLAPYRFEIKEPISMLNGTPIMTGIAVVVADRLRKITRAAMSATALGVHALLGHAHHLHPTIFDAKPHPGSRAVARELRDMLCSESDAPESTAPAALQDPYSLRCAPHVIGVLADASSWVERWLEIEANGVSDNPLFDPGTGRVLMGGNFYGGHVAFAMDSVKAVVASVADLCDRQVALLIDSRFSRGLPEQLCTDDAPGRHGFKGLQITMSALTAEALQAGMPAASFSRSTESHNQDKVSMGTVAARDALRVCEIVEKVVAIDLIVSAQACEVRGSVELRPGIARLVDTVRRLCPPLSDDRCLDGDLTNVADAIAAGAFGEAALS
jgi:histidine ammonia-lyase